MTRTPCMDNPDLWTSDHASDRALALTECRTACWRLTECHAQTETDLANGLPVIGVSGGVDYDPRKSGKGSTVCATCGEPVDTKGTRRRYCNDTCRLRLAYRRKIGKAA